MAAASKGTGFEVLIRDLNQALVNNRILIAAANSVLVKQKERIFQNGTDAFSSSIGKYSTKPTYISEKRQAKKVGKTKFPGGYREYKTLLGKGGGDKVNLRDTDQMMFDLGTTVVDEKAVGIGFSNEFNYNKSQWAESHFDKVIFNTSQSEDDAFIQTLEFELERSLGLE